MLQLLQKCRLPVLLIFCLAPLLLLTYYNQPYWDDYGFAALYRQLGAVASFKQLYLHTGGRFVSNIFFTVANPLSYGWLGGVKAFALLAIGAQIGAIFFAFRAFTNRQLPALQTAWHSLGLWLLYVFTIPDIHSGVYWFASLVVHSLACCLLLVVPAAVVRAQQSVAHARAWTVTAAVATFLLAGTSELVVLMLGVVLLTGAGRCVYLKQPERAKKWALLLVVLGVGFGLAVAAPGNYERMASAPVLRLPLMAALAQLGQGLRIVLWQPVFFALLVVPILFSPLVPALQACRPPGVRLPLLLGASIVLLGLVGGTIMLSLLIGPALLARGVNVLYWWTLFGWLAACWASLPEAIELAPPFSPAVRTLVMVLLGVVAAAPTVRAWQEALFEAPQWAAQCEARNRKYTDPRNRYGKLTVPPITHVTPRYVLVRGYDIQPYYNHALNIPVAKYFELDSVRTDGNWPVRASF